MRDLFGAEFNYSFSCVASLARNMKNGEFERGSQLLVASPSYPVPKIQCCVNSAFHTEKNSKTTAGCS